MNTRYALTPEDIEEIVDAARAETEAQVERNRAARKERERCEAIEAYRLSLTTPEL